MLCGYAQLNDFECKFGGFLENNQKSVQRLHTSVQRLHTFFPKS